ncbi:MAG: ATP-binding protein [Burkholderiaceae bacterium]
MTGAARPLSLQRRLLYTVLALVMLAWAAGAILTWRDAEHEVGELLDAHLAQAAALLRMQPLDELDEDGIHPAPELHRYQPRVVFQVWHEGRLLAHSANAPQQPLSAQHTPGFYDSRADGKSWRVFVTPGKDADLLLQVGELQAARAEIVLASLRSMARPLAFTLPLLALAIWWAVRASLRPLRTLGQALRARQPESLAPLPTQGVPPDVLPLVEALNGLFERIAHLLTAEQQFTADAAHELRTPIAGIRMQAQVAQGARDEAERATALAATVQGCDRATRLVEQLLQLARLDAEVAPAHPPAQSDLADAVRSIAADLQPRAQARQQTLRLELPPTHAATVLPEALAQVLVRNLLDNALRYSPPGAQIRVRVESLRPTGRGASPQAHEVLLCVEDSGPGLDAADMARLGERFFRARSASHSGGGSGLGWSIVQRLARLYHLQVQVDRSPDLGGLRVRIGVTVSCAGHGE